MDKEKKETGYPHIDKPWMKYYEGLDLKEKDLDFNLANYLRLKNLSRNGTAVSYYGKEISYDEYFYNADLASKCFSELGVKKGDIIMCMLPNIPEAGEVLMGASQIGAIADFIDPRPDSMDVAANAKKVLELIKYEKPNYIVALEECYLAMIKPIENELKELGIDTIITVSAKDSMNLKGKIDYLHDVAVYNELNNIRNKDEMIKKLKNYQAVLNRVNMMSSTSKAYKDAVSSSPLKVYNFSLLKKECEKARFEEVNDSDLVNYIGHTSGTSGARPKPIALTNKNAISSIEQCMLAKVSSESGNRALHILPYFAPFGAYNNYLLNLAAGVTNIDVPEFEINEFGYLIKKYKPNAIMTTPAWLVGLMECSYLDNFDLSFLRKVIYGGDSMTKEDEEKLNIWLKNHGSTVEIEKGHGMSEFCGCGSYARSDYNKDNSIGIPIPRTIYTMVDPSIDDKLVPLKFKEGEEFLTGEIAVSSSHVTNGTLHGDIIVPHFELDGDSYIRTRDIGKMDRDGVFFIEGRKDRSFARFDGYKVKPFEIEKEIEKNPNVKYARIVEYYDDKKRGNMPICHLVLENDVNDSETIEIIRDIVYNQIINNENMSSRQIPSKFKIRESMPLNKNSKVDCNQLRSEELSGDEINVDISETNLSTGDIEIYRNEIEKSKQRIRR